MLEYSSEILSELPDLTSEYSETLSELSESIFDPSVNDSESSEFTNEPKT